jgi:hypothetical protein
MSTPSVQVVIVAVVFVIFGGMAFATQDKYAVQVPGGLAGDTKTGCPSPLVTPQTRSIK